MNSHRIVPVWYHRWPCRGERRRIGSSLEVSLLTLDGVKGCFEDAEEKDIAVCGDEAEELGGLESWN